MYIVSRNAQIKSRSAKSNPHGSYPGSTVCSGLSVPILRVNTLLPHFESRIFLFGNTNLSTISLITVCHWQQIHTNR